MPAMSEINGAILNVMFMLGSDQCVNEAMNHGVVVIQISRKLCQRRLYIKINTPSTLPALCGIARRTVLLRIRLVTFPWCLKPPIVYD
jgi:hypothetical protein